MSAANPQFITSPDTLSRDERALFKALVRDPSHVFTKEELLRAMFPRDRYASPRKLDSAAVRLRRKLEEFDGRRAVCNVWGVGYRYSEPAPRRAGSYECIHCGAAEAMPGHYC